MLVCLIIILHPQLNPDCLLMPWYVKVLEKKKKNPNRLNDLELADSADARNDTEMNLGSKPKEFTDSDQLNMAVVHWYTGINLRFDRKYLI